VSDVSTIVLDIAKQASRVLGSDASGHVMFRKKLTRARLIEFFRSQPQCLVALEACGGAHYWGREIARLGHTVRLIPPAYVKPFVKRQKNDAADAEAICEAAQRPNMRFVAIKNEEQQASGVVRSSIRATAVGASPIAERQRRPKPVSAERGAPPETTVRSRRSRAAHGAPRRKSARVRGGGPG
jgi:transposase